MSSRSDRARTPEQLAAHEQGLFAAAMLVAGLANEGDTVRHLWDHYYGEPIPPDYWPDIELCRQVLREMAERL